MATKSKKRQTAFRFDKDLLNALEIKAKADNRSLNNYIETILFKVVGNIPNDETKEALYEADNNIDLTPIDNLNEFFAEIEKEAKRKDNV
ncbi:MAG: hypothetical protein OIF50_05945 [Flavobacteriaceae bacterium]|nr:hypothetical protein [Flavobacteriaceae bacterium]